ncbi:MAG: hypothetical protein AAFV69_15090, partial [Pseudomonadota bacterium]
TSAPVRLSNRMLLMNFKCGIVAIALDIVLSDAPIYLTGMQLAMPLRAYSVEKPYCDVDVCLVGPAMSKCQWIARA